MKNLLATYPRSFYERPTVAVAHDLLGSNLVRRQTDGSLLPGRIIEVEAYTQDDSACHAFRGLTERVKVMFGPPGYAYIYFIYGVHFCFNVVTEKDGIPGAVLIRAVELPDIASGQGPGRLCKSMNIGRDLYGADLCDSRSDIWINPGDKYSESEIEASSRVGVTTAQDKLWRFYVKEHKGVSKYRQYKKK